MKAPKSNFIFTYFENRIEFKRWELVKYAAVTFCMLLPCIGRLFNYWTASCLMVFIAFFCLCFGLYASTGNVRWSIEQVIEDLGSCFNRGFRTAKIRVGCCRESLEEAIRRAQRVISELPRGM